MSGYVFLALRILLALSLYAFLGWGLWTLWQDLRRQDRLLSIPQTPPLLLTLMDGKSSGNYRFTSQEVLVGRDPACNLHLEDATISAQHARLAYHHGQWWVEDLKSTNGTYLNQEPVLTPTVLAAGDELRCGQLVMQVALGDNRE